ncbi:MAG: serine--tRNA ligase [Patescibacteria group bacterium]
MLDIKFIRENPEIVREAIRKKQVKFDLEKFFSADEIYRGLLKKTEDARAEHNTKSDTVARADAAERNALIAGVQEGKSNLQKLEEDLRGAEAGWKALLSFIPNSPASDVKEGKDDSENEVLKTVGQPSKFDFEPKDYIALTEQWDIIDTARAGKVSGSRFGYLKGEAAMLEMALVFFALDTLRKEGFIPVIPPVMINETPMRAMGYMDRGGDEIYKIEGENLYLVGTSEQSIGPMHMNEVFEERDLPRRYVGFSSCFRKEAGASGKDTRGILRVHQFNKVEMFSYTTPEQSDAEHAFILSLEEKLVGALDLPYHVLGICSGDLGDPAARKYDIECWVPSQGKYRETHSCSSCTDFQARRLNIKYRSEDGLKYVHTLNGTAFATGRMLIAILENFQQADGTVRVPEVLVPYCGFRIIGEKK